MEIKWIFSSTKSLRNSIRRSCFKWNRKVFLNIFQVDWELPFPARVKGQLFWASLDCRARLENRLEALLKTFRWKVSAESLSGSSRWRTRIFNEDLKNAERAGIPLERFSWVARPLWTRGREEYNSSSFEKFDCNISDKHCNIPACKMMIVLR